MLSPSPNSSQILPTSPSNKIQFYTLLKNKTKKPQETHTNQANNSGNNKTQKMEFKYKEKTDKTKKCSKSLQTDYRTSFMLVSYSCPWDLI